MAYIVLAYIVTAYVVRAYIVRTHPCLICVHADMRAHARAHERIAQSSAARLQR